MAALRFDSTDLGRTEEFLGAACTDPTTGVTVAARWGFSPGAFTSFYREQYGTLPSHTLHT